MNRILCLTFFVLCAGFTVADGMRFKRSGTGGSTSSSSSSSSSYSSSSSSGGTGGGLHQQNFMFPMNNPFPSFTNMGGFPDFNGFYRQFVSSLQSAQAQAALNPTYAQVFQQQLAELIAQQQLAMAQFPFAFPNVDSNTIHHGTGGFGSGNYGSGGYGGNTGGSNTGSTYTSSSVHYGPQGGFGQASAFPGGPDSLGVRIAEELPAPSGSGTFGVFSSSSSGTSEVNGKRTSYKTSTFGTNDNGKITFRTVSE